MTETVHRLTETEADALRGCWLEGSRGWRALVALVEIADGRGMPLDADDRVIVDAYLEGRVMVELTGGEFVDSHDCAAELADKAEAWLNEHVAAAGWSFGWTDGEFFLWPASEWEHVR